MTGRAFVNNSIYYVYNLYFVLFRNHIHFDLDGHNNYLLGEYYFIRNWRLVFTWVTPLTLKSIWFPRVEIIEIAIEVTTKKLYSGRSIHERTYYTYICTIQKLSHTAAIIMPFRCYAYVVCSTKRCYYVITFRGLIKLTNW